MSRQEWSRYRRFRVREGYPAWVAYRLAKNPTEALDPARFCYSTVPGSEVRSSIKFMLTRQLQQCGGFDR